VSDTGLELSEEVSAVGRAFRRKNPTNSSILSGCGLDVADRRCAANTPRNPVHIQFAFPAQRLLQSTTIGRPTAQRGYSAVSEEVSSRNGCLRFRISAADNPQRREAVALHPSQGPFGRWVVNVRCSPTLVHGAGRNPVGLSLHEFLVRGDWLFQSPRRQPGRNSSQQPLAAGRGSAPCHSGELHRTEPSDRK
jgi:hypothetical protein